MIESASWAHIGLSVAAGSLTTLSPCVFPILPLVVGGALQSNRFAPIAMGLGMTLSFTTIGILLGALQQTLGIDSESIRQIGAILLLAFALTLLIPYLNQRFSEIVMPIASSANEASAQLNSGSLFGSFLLGGLLGLVWSPCSGPMLGTAFTLAASEGTVGNGALILGLFGLGAAIPLVAVAYVSRSGFSHFRDKFLGHIDRAKKAFGVFIGITAIAILTGADKILEAKIVTLLPDIWVDLITKF